MENEIKVGDKVKLNHFEDEALELLKSMEEYIGTEAEMMANKENDDYAACFKMHDGSTWYWPLSAMEKVS